MRGTLIWGVVALALVVAGPAAAEARSVAPHGVRERVQLPAPGHVAVEGFKFGVRKRGARRPPARLPVHMPEARSLPSSARILWARRTIRTRRSTTYLLVALVINRAGSASHPRAVVGTAGNPPGADYHGLGNSGGSSASP